MRLHSPRRALVYAFHDLEGIVDDANLSYLAALVEQVERSVVVVNGELAASGRARIEDLGATVIHRQNQGYDIWAFKTGIESLGDALPGFDELIVANSSVFGPVRPLADALREMDERDVDFWGITRHAALSSRPRLGRSPRAERAHIQSYFTAFRRPVLESAAFRDYWRDLPPIRDYADAVRAHEMVMTGYFEDAGFRWDTLVDTSDLEPFSDNPLIGLAAPLLDRGCPVFKRRMLYIGTDGLLAHSAGSAAQELWARLRSTPGVDLDALERHVVRTMRAEDAQRALQDFVRIDDGDVASTAGVAAVVLPGPLAVHQVEHLTAEGVRTAVLANDRDAVPEAPPGRALEVVRTGAAPAHLALSLVDAPLLYVLPSIAEPRHEADARVAHEHSRAALGWSADELGRVAAAFRDSAVLGAVLAPPSPARNFFGGIGGAMDDERRTAMSAVCVALGADPAALGDTVPGGGLWIRHEAAAAWDAAIAAMPADVRGRAAKRLRPHDWTSVMIAVLPRLGWRVRRGLSRRLGETLVAVSSAAFASINRAAEAREGEGLEATLHRIDHGVLSATVFFDVGPGFAHVTSRSFALRAGEPVEIRVQVPEEALGVRLDPLEGSGALVEGITIEPEGLTIAPLNGSRARGVDLFSSHDPAYLVGGSAAGREIVIRAEQIVRLQADPTALELVERRFGAAGAVARARHLAMRVRSKAVRTLRRR